MTYPERVKQTLWGDIAAMSEAPWRFALNPESDFTRNRKLDFENLLRFLVTMESGTTGHELLKYFDFSVDTVSCSAFYQQRKKLRPDAFPHLLRLFNSHFAPALHNGRYTLVACDGCEFCIARNPEDPETFYPLSNGSSPRGHNRLHTTSLFDLLNKTYLDCEIQPGRNRNEFRAICSLIDRYSCGGNPIFIADRGFSSCNTFAHAAEKGVYYLIRAKDINTRRFLGVSSLPDSIDTHVDLILTRSQSAKKMARPDLKGQYRYISAEVIFDYIGRGSDSEYPLSFRVVRFATADGVFENIVTNLPAGEFPPGEIKSLYNMRWGIETSFRDLKYTIGATNFHSKKPVYIGQEIWARLILFNFCAVITMHVVLDKKDTKHIYQVNFAMAMKICHHFIRLRSHDPPVDVERLIGSHSLPIRHGRNYARRHKFRLPASFCYRF